MVSNRRVARWNLPMQRLIAPIGHTRRAIWERVEQLSGCGSVLDCTNDGRENSAACASSDHL
jgi:hypothetical protein